MKFGQDTYIFGRKGSVNIENLVVFFFQETKMKCFGLGLEDYG